MSERKGERERERAGEGVGENTQQEGDCNRHTVRRQTDKLTGVNPLQS